MTPRYCSSKCRIDCNRATYRPKATQKPRTCSHCGKSFTALGDTKKSYCSKSCSHKAAVIRGKKNAPGGNTQLTWLEDRIAREGGLEAFLASATHLEIEARKALARYAEKLPYTQYEACYRMIARSENRST
jgi:hypothetical protein